MNTTATETTNTPATVNGRKAVSITLETPIERKGGAIKCVQLMKPTTGDLRGLLLAELLQFKTDAIIKLLPRITVPTISEPEIAAMDPADTVTMAMEVADFLMPRAAMASLPA